MEFKIGERVSLPLTSARWSQECSSASTRNQSQSSAMTEADGRFLRVLPKAESSLVLPVGPAKVIDAHELGDPLRRSDDVSRY
jgi:hypothetical protein